MIDFIHDDPIHTALKKETEIKIPSFLFKIAPPDGLIKDTVDWICETAIMPQPELALYNTLAFAGAVFGRRYVLINDMRTNVYIVGLADTGQGKEHSRRMLNKLAYNAKLSQFMGANSVRSAAGLAVSLERHASQLFMIDEFGLFLQTLSDDKAASYKKEIANMFILLYGASASAYHHGQIADKKDKAISLIEPCLSIYGTSTLSSYHPALKKRSIDDGNLNRFIVLPSITDVKVNRNQHTNMPDNLVRLWENYAPYMNGEVFPGDQPSQNLITVRIDPELKDINFEMQEMALHKCKTTENGQLWMRYPENTLKIAMICAIARNKDRPVINRDDMAFSQVLVMQSVEYMLSLTNEYMAENSIEASKMSILRFAKASYKSLNAITKNFQGMHRKDVVSILDDLVAEDRLSKERSSGMGRPTDVYF